MNTGILIPLGMICTLAAFSSNGHGDHPHSHVASLSSKTNAVALDKAKLPPLPEGVHELKFSELFRRPIGPAGLEFTERLRGLDGKRVRVLGYMVRQERPLPRRLLLAAVPVTLHEEEYGFAEDLPASTLHVMTAEGTPDEVPFTPGLLLLTGKLSVGTCEEADGRISTVRLHLDPPEKSGVTAPAKPISACSTDMPSQK